MKTKMNRNRKKQWVATGISLAIASGMLVQPVMAETAAEGNTETTLEKTANETENKKPRVIITNDGEIDDKNSFIRLLYYANDLNLVGLVQSSSFAHWAGSPNGVGVKNMGADGSEEFAWPGTEWMDEFIDNYAEIYPNLVAHDSEYPTPEYLHSIVRIGNIGYMGEMDESTEGSNLIKDTILDDSTEPLYITAWGGMNTIGRAFMDIYQEYGETEEWDTVLQKIYDKVRIYTWYGQDGKDENGEDPVLGGVLAKYFSKLTIVDVHSCQALGWGWENATTNNGSEANSNHQIPEVLTGAWMQENLEGDYGPLMEHYVTYGDGTYVEGNLDEFQMGSDDNLMTAGWFCGTGRERYDFMGEGDTPTFLLLLDLGFNLGEDYGAGTLAGRFVKDEDLAKVGVTNYYVPENDTIVMSDWANVGQETQAATYDSGARWITDLMNDFAARADWGMTDDYASANHNPEIAVENGNEITAAPGEKVSLTAVATDPDGDNVVLKWFNYPEAGTYGKEVVIDEGADSETMTFTVPEDAANGATIHMLVKATDDGNHTLSQYQRVVVTVAAEE